VSKQPTNPEERSDVKLPDRQKQNAIHEPRLGPKDIAQSPDEQVLNSGYNFYETWEGVESTCPSCGWRVSLSRSHTIHKNDRIEFLCGNCRETLSGVRLPTQAEAAIGDRLSMVMFECLEAREKGFQRECDLKIRMEEGFCAPKIEDSMLGLNWSSFATRSFPEHSEDTSFGTHRSLSPTHFQCSMPIAQLCLRLTSSVLPRVFSISVAGSSKERSILNCNWSS
jgi:hypothetical protein